VDVDDGPWMQSDNLWGREIGDRGVFIPGKVLGNIFKLRFRPGNFLNEV